MDADEVSIGLLILAISFIVIVKAFSELLALIDFGGLLLIMLRPFDRVIGICRVFMFSLIDRDLIAVVLLSALIASVVSSWKSSTLLWIWLRLIRRT